MNITFLIGNGFDVGMGLKSKFSDYFPKYIEASKNKPHSLRALADEIDIHRDEWSYFERQAGKYTTKFSSDTQKQYIEQLKDFEKGFISYLKQEEEKLSYDDKNKIISTLVKALQEFYKNDNLAAESTEQITNLFSKYVNQNHKYNFVNFNYTFVLWNCLELLSDRIVSKRKYNGTDYIDKLAQVVHIHGYEDYLPIMGVNDSTQIDNEELAKDQKFLKYIVKPLLNKFNRTNNDKKATELIRASNIICVYGMALGETDKKWWRLILEWLAGSSERHFIIFDYDEKYSPSSQFDWLEKEDSIIDKLTNYAEGMKIEVDSLRSRIHIAIHKNIFALNLRKEEIEEEVAFSKVY